MFEEAFSSSEFDDKDSFDKFSPVYTTSLSVSTSLNISSTALCPFSLYFLTESNYGLSFLTLWLSILAAFIQTVKSAFIISLFLDLLCIPGIFDFSKSTSFRSFTFFPSFLIFLSSYCLPLSVSFSTLPSFSLFIKLL